jgi:hypothetical protein
MKKHSTSWLNLPENLPKHRINNARREGISYGSEKVMECGRVMEYWSDGVVE